MDPDEFELEEIQDQANVVGKLTPREYAKLRGVAPQLIYYYIRNKVLVTEHCICGRKVLDVKTSDSTLQTRAEKRGQKLDTRADRDTETGHEEMVPEL